MFMEPLQIPFIESNVFFLVSTYPYYTELKQRELYGGHQQKFNQFSLKKRPDQKYLQLNHSWSSNLLSNK